MCGISLHGQDTTDGQTFMHLEEYLFTAIESELLKQICSDYYVSWKSSVVTMLLTMCDGTQKVYVDT